MAIGYSFAPGADISMEGRNGGGPTAGKGLSPQQAVKILSLRVPESLPSNAPVNRSLLTSPGGSAPGAGGLQSLIQQLIQSFKPQADAGAGDQPSPMLPQPPTNAQAGMSPAWGQLPSLGMPVPGAPQTFQSFPNAPAMAPQPMHAPHITWGDEHQMGPAPPLTLGQNPDEAEEWNRMFNLGPSGGLSPWLQGGR